ncbi:MAG: anti-sigma regulatory factor [Dehalococcoidia bacterium]|nr:anti-sigma regulatory factor [Dehalococcoidia bacterium]
MGEEKSVLIKNESDIVNACFTGKQMAARIGLGIVEQSHIVTAIAELARNIIAYAGSGVISFHFLGDAEDSGLEIMAVDSGPGIADTELAIRGVCASGGELCGGLLCAKRLMDEFEIESGVGRGTTVTIRKWKTEQQTCQ